MINNTTNPLPCIVINRMCTGDYVKHYLGHEIINLYRADDAKYYLYLNSDGQLINNCCDNGIMLMAKPLGDYTIEVFAIATDLKIAEGVLSKEIHNDPKCPNRKQDNYIRKKNITYNGVDLINIFKNNPSQSVYVTFETESVVFAKPGNKIFIQFAKATSRSHGPGLYVRLTGIGYPNSSLRNFVFHDSVEKQDYDTLMNEIINNHFLWDIGNQNNRPSICPDMEREFLDRINKLKL